MKIFDTNGILIEKPDLEKGRLERDYKPITHRYEITQKEKGHYEVVKEYPNGGKEVEWRIDTPEEGQWVTYDTEGNRIETENLVPDDAPHETEIKDYEEIAIYIPYTEEELEKMATEEPTQLDILEAQVTYTAMMTDTLLEV